MARSPIHMRSASIRAGTESRSYLARAWRVAELVALRLALPSRVARKPLDALLAELTPSFAPSGIAVQAASSLRRDVLRVESALRHVPWLANTCLYRALARYAMLRGAGMDATFVMGLGPQGVHDDGHAWVEVAGKPFEEADDVSRFPVTFRYPPASKAC